MSEGSHEADPVIVRYYDVTDGKRLWKRRRRMLVPRVGEDLDGWYVIRVDPIEGRSDHVEALVHVRKLVEQR